MSLDNVSWESLRNVFIFCCFSIAFSQAREETCERIRKEDPVNTEYVPSADHPFMMEGQGTIGLEMLQQVCYNYPFLYFLRTSKFLLG